MRIDITNVSLEYKGHGKYGARKKALSGIDLRIESPNLIGLVGPNGAGKTTLMKLLSAGLLPTGGNIAVNGVPLAKCEKELKAKLGYLPQSFGLFDELSVRQFLDYM
jgi:ABC-type multidrug transport system ATPase subunit